MKVLLDSNAYSQLSIVGFAEPKFTLRRSGQMVERVAALAVPAPYRFSTSRPARYLWMTLDNSV